jgi:acyl-CoA dehydrogenase
MWDFSTEPKFQKKLDWMNKFVREEVEPLGHLFHEPGAPYNVGNKQSRAALKPLMEEVRRQDLWACHLGPELGGKGYGQVKLALMNEILGRSIWAPVVFGTAAPDTGNAEILAHYGTEEQKAKYLQPLIDGDIVSCFSMTEPAGGSDPTTFITAAVQDGDDWVINGHKWFSSHSKFAAFMIVIARTNPEAPVHKQFSMFLVPAETPGLKTIRNVGLMDEPLGVEGAHGYLHYDNVRVPASNLLGAPGQGFEIAQTRLGGGRIHHAMRTVGEAQMMLDMMCEQAVSRSAKGGVLSEKQFVQGDIANSAMELHQLRLLVLHTAWLIDQGDHNAVRKGIAMSKVLAPRVMEDIVKRTMHIYGSWGVSNEMPFLEHFVGSALLSVVDGPSEVHVVTIAKQILRGYSPRETLLPTAHRLAKVEAARIKYAAYLGDRDDTD